jgi:tetratricopeptide (TPR) repeat protein
LAESKQLSANILEHEPKNLQAWIINFEVNKAGNFQADGDQFDFESFSKSEDPLYPVVVSEILEKMLDEQRFDDCWSLFNSLDEHNKNNPVIKSIEANLVFIEGNLAEADEIFSSNTIGLVEKAGSEKLLRMISTRLAIKTAVRLSRWEEALKWAKLLAEQYPWNRDLSALYLSTMVQALELSGTAETLQITKHSSVIPLGEIDADKELDWLRANLAHDENAERLYIRGKLASTPDQEMVKAYAHFKPTGEDAAVLIRALSKIGHGKTAEQIGKKYQDNASVLFQNALLELEDNPEEAFDFANKLIGLNANNPVGLALRSLIDQKISKNEQAVADIESALILWPDEVNWHKIASDLWTTLGNDQKAIQHLEFMNEKDPNDVGTGIRLAKAYFARKDYDSSINLLKTISQIDPNMFEVWEGLTDAQLAKGLVNEALDSADKASEVNPFSIKPYLLRAQIDLDNGLVDKAYEQVKLADQKVNDNAEVKVFLAKVLFARGEKTAALQELENATHSENLTPMIILSEIRLIKEINGTASARNLIEYFAKKMPENAELLSLLAESQLENGDSHAAEVTARRVLKLKPDSIEMLKFMGKQQLKKGQLDQAIHSFSQVINLDSKNIEAYSELGAAYQQQREISKAVEVLKQIIDIDPFETSAYVSLANLYKDSKNYKLAEEMLKKAAEMEPKNVSIKRQLGALLALNLVHQSQEVSSQL